MTHLSDVKPYLSSKESHLPGRAARSQALAHLRPAAASARDRRLRNKHASGEEDANLGCGQTGSTLMGPLQKQLFLTNWGKRYALALLGRQKQVNWSTQKVPLSKNMKFVVTPLVLTPFVHFRT